MLFFGLPCIGKDMACINTVLTCFMFLCFLNFIDFVFCDAHKAPGKHDCEFDFAKMGKDLLTKANPKLNEKPTGGRSFTRIQ